MHKATGQTGRSAERGSLAPSRPSRATDPLKTDAERAAYLEALLGECGSRVITIGLRNLAESIGGITAIA